MTPLDRIIGLETTKEILSILTPRQLAVIALRWQGLQSKEIAALLGVSDEVVSMRFVHARRAILRQMPHLAPQIAGRRFSRARNLPPDYPVGAAPRGCPGPRAYPSRPHNDN